MSEKIVQLNEEVIKDQIKELVRGSVEETLNELLEVGAQKLIQRSSPIFFINLTTTSGEVTLKVPKLKGISIETTMLSH